MGRFFNQTPRQIVLEGSNRRFDGHITDEQRSFILLDIVFTEQAHREFDELRETSRPLRQRSQPSPILPLCPPLPIVA